MSLTRRPCAPALKPGPPHCHRSPTAACLSWHPPRTRAGFCRLLVPPPTTALQPCCAPTLALCGPQCSRHILRSRAAAPFGLYLVPLETGGTAPHERPQRPPNRHWPRRKLSTRHSLLHWHSPLGPQFCARVILFQCNCTPLPRAHPRPHRPLPPLFAKSSSPSLSACNVTRPSLVFERLATYTLQ